MIKWIFFAVIALVIAYISRKSMLKPHSHGFWRFFAWELILILMTLNLEKWFVHPWSWHQIIAWMLLFASIVPLLFGVRTLIARGKAVEQRESEPQLMAFEKTSALVTTGIYRTIRHPLYSSLLFLTWGVFFKSPSWIGAALAIAATACLYLTAKMDERECITYFGESYREYMMKTKRFIPFIF